MPIFVQAQFDSTRLIRKLDSIFSIPLLPGRINYNQPPAFAQHRHHSKPGSSGFSIPSVERPMSNNNCRDTSSRIAIRKDSINFYLTTPVRSKDGNLFLSGVYDDYWHSSLSDKGFLMKCDLYGNVLWATLYDSLQNTMYHEINYYQLIELMDGSILLAGTIYDGPTMNEDLILTKVDASGNITWTKDYYSRKWTNGHGSSDAFFVQQMKQDPVNGDVYLVSPGHSGMYLLKIDISNGDITWSTHYQGTSRVGGIIVKPGEIVATGSNYASNGYLMIYRISKSNGDTIATRLLRLQDAPASKKAFLTLDPLQELPNGSFSFSGRLFGAFEYMYNGVIPLYQAGVAILDSNLDFVNAYCFRNNVESNMYNSRVAIHPDGSGLFSMLQGTGSYRGDIYQCQFKNGVILKQRKRAFTDEGYPYETIAIPFDNGADLVVQQVGDNVRGYSNLVLSKLHLTDTSSDCMGRETTLTFTEPLHYAYTGHIRIDSIPRGLMLERRVRTLVSNPLPMGSPIPFCDQSSFCDTLRLSVDNDTTCPQQAVLLHTFKNRECGGMVQFSYDTSALQSFVAINDSTYQLVFRGRWQGYIRGSLAGCSLHSDSVFITVLEAPPVLALGSDTDICPGNQIILNAKQGYATYQWQDGSTDSLFTVTQPGTYYVTATNACGGQFSDTVHVLAHQPPPFTLGNDVSICLKDSAYLIATPGFSNYQWSSTASYVQYQPAVIKVSPASSADYLVQATEQPGCQVHDTIRVWVTTAPLIQLGADTSICAGSTLTLDAGGGFTQYHWNTGDTSRLLSTGAAGLYTVTAYTAAGCLASDSLRVLQLYSSPVVNLGSDTILCAGTTRTLDPGPFAHYLWNSGDTSRLFNISSTGQYSVTVTNLNQCSATSTLNISTSIIPPAGFLPADSNICRDQLIVLSASQPFSGYTWNTGQQTASISVQQPGLYWLQVTDTWHCSGRDSIQLLPKQYPAVQLGRDTSFCAGQMIVLDAGAGFTHYHWNTGDSSRVLIADNAGLYVVSATASNGCTATDSLRIVQVFSNPVVNLGNDSNICIGGQRTLDAGSFTTYSWSTGSSNRIIVASDTGLFRVNVTDINHCSGSSSLHINTRVEPPSGFLPPDTAICTYGQALLTASRAFNIYQWSNGQTSASIKVQQPGIYWLQGTDQYHCTGRDSINILPKDCMRGLFVPTAFSPGSAVGNQLIRPLIFGNVLQYQWTIYNRYGQSVFISSTPLQGWDGVYKGIPQNAGTYVWVCRYRLAGEMISDKRGSFVLLR